MKLQIKYNFTELDTAIALGHETKEYADIMEIGQLLIFKYGLEGIKAFCKEFPDKKIYVDIKLSERPEESMQIFSGIGISYISILAGAYHSIIRKACEAASKEKIGVVIDLINTTMPGQAAVDAKTLGAQGLLIHRENALSEELNNFQSDWQQIKDNSDLPIFVQGKINQENISQIISLKPHVVIVGDAITRAKNPRNEAAAVKKMLAHTGITGPQI